MTRFVSGLLLVALAVVAEADSFPGKAISEDVASGAYGLACHSYAWDSVGCTSCGPVCDRYVATGSGEGSYNVVACFVGQQTCGTYHDETGCGFSS